MKDITLKEEDKKVEELKDDANTFEEDLNKLKLQINSGNKNWRSNFSTESPPNDNKYKASPNASENCKLEQTNKKFHQSKTMVTKKK